MLSLDVVGRALVLSQSKVPEFLDSPMGSFTLSEEWMGVEWKEWGDSRRRGGEWELGSVSKMRKDCF